MMRQVGQLVRFFHVVRVVPTSTLAGFVFIVSIGGIVTILDPRDAPRALGPVLLLQLLASSSGFQVPARRGYFDLPLSCGHARLRVAVMHCAMSVGPGIASWLVLGLVELMVSRGSRVVVLSTGSLAALLLVSLLSWALSAPFPRLTGGLVWLATLVSAVALGPAAARASLTAAWLSGDGPLPGPGLILLCPWLIVGRALDFADLGRVGLAVIVAASAAAGACVWIWRADVPLEAAQ
jgi:hypothetical protein